MVECKRCLNVESFDTLIHQPIRITPSGLCNQCDNWEINSKEFYKYRQAAKEQLPKIFDKIKSENHEYDAVVCLSGGKDSSAALILAKEKYNLKVLAFTIDKGTFYDGVKQQIDKITDELGVDHVFVKAPKPLVNRIFRFGIKTLSNAGIQCKLCGGLLHVPIQSRFLLKYDSPIVITGLDLWEIYGGYTLEKNRKTKLINPFLYTFPTLKKRWNDYQLTIDDCLNLLKRFSSEDQFSKLKEEFMQIANDLISRYGLSPGEIGALKKAELYDIGLPAIEISSKKQQLRLLEEHGWSPPKDMFTGEIIGTDCRIGGLVNAITSFKQKRKLWSYRIRTGLVTKDEAIEEINRRNPDVERICHTLNQIGIKKLQNQLIGGWKNKKFKDVYDTQVIDKVNAQIC